MLGAYTLQSDCSGSTNMPSVLRRINSTMMQGSTYSSKNRRSVRVSAAITITGRAADAPESCEQLCSITRSFSGDAVEGKPATRKFTNRVQRRQRVHLIATYQKFLPRAEGCEEYDPLDCDPAPACCGADARCRCTPTRPFPVNSEAAE